MKSGTLAQLDGPEHNPFYQPDTLSYTTDLAPTTHFGTTTFTLAQRTTDDTMSLGFDALSGYLSPVRAAVTSVSPAYLCQASFVGLAAAIVTLTLLPAATQKLLLDYGARDSKSTVADPKGKGKAKEDDRPDRPAPEPEPDFLSRIVGVVVSRLQVPHSWFISFYAFYLVLTFYWAAQWWSWTQADAVGQKTTAPDSLFGRILQCQQFVDLVGTSNPATSMVLAQVAIAFALEALQTGRRLYEYLYVFKPSKATMNVAHFLLGFAYYAIMSVAIWVEGSRMSSFSTRPSFVLLVFCFLFDDHSLTLLTDRGYPGYEASGHNICGICSHR